VKEYIEENIIQNGIDKINEILVGLYRYAESYGYNFKPYIGGDIRPRLNGKLEKTYLTHVDSITYKGVDKDVSVKEL